MNIEHVASAFELVAFHTRHKLLLMAHAPSAVAALGRVVARAGSGDWETQRQEYQALLQSVLAVPRTRGKHVNVLQHMVGYVRDELPEAEQRALAATIDAYAQGQVPLERPRDLIHHYARQQRVAYLLDQIYFDTPE